MPLDGITVMKVLSAVKRLGWCDVTEHFIKYQDVRRGRQLSRHGTLTLQNKDVNYQALKSNIRKKKKSNIRVWRYRTLLPRVPTVHYTEVYELNLACIPVNFNCFNNGFVVFLYPPSCNQVSLKKLHVISYTYLPTEKKTTSLGRGIFHGILRKVIYLHPD